MVDDFAERLAELSGMGTPRGANVVWQAARRRLRRRRFARLAVLGVTIGGLVTVVAVASAHGARHLATPAASRPSTSTPNIPALTTIHPAVTASPATGLTDGQRVTVRVTGFGVGGKVWLSECASYADATDLGCGPQLPAQTLLVTGNDRTGVASFIVRGWAPAKAYDSTGAQQPCSPCVIVATLGGGFGYAFTPITFRGSRASDGGSYPENVLRAMTHTVEVDFPDEHFKPGGFIVSTSDGQGGTIDAIVGIRTPTADGKGQLVFFFHNGAFVGWDASQEATSILGLVAAEPRAVVVTYANYGPHDPVIGASLPPATVTYRWDGNRMTPEKPPPAGVYGLNDPTAVPLRVKLVAGTEAQASQASPTRLSLSSTAGPAGTQIAIAASGCPAVPGHLSSVYWHDAYNAAHPAQAGSRDLVALTRRQISTGDVRSTYLVTTADPPGRSVIVVECGGFGGNAVGYFTVTR